VGNRDCHHIFLTCSAGFLGIFAAYREDWWAAIPGSALLGIGAITVLQVLGQDPGTWSGALFLGVLGLGFWAIYLIRRIHWWPIIPGGTLLALAGTVVASDTAYVEQSGAVFLGGLGLTFALVFLLRLPRRDTRWAIIPAAALALLAIPAAGGGTWIGSLVPMVFAVTLIGAGTWLLLRVRLRGETS
jgi:hypothetical protein